MIDFLKIFWALSSERACCSSSYIGDRSWYHFMCQLLLLHRSNFSIYLHFLAISILCIDRKALFKEVVQDLLWCKHLIYCRGSVWSYTHVRHLCPTAVHYMLCWPPPIAIQLVIRQDLRCDNMCLDVRKIEGILPHFTCSFCLTCMCDVGL